MVLSSDMNPSRIITVVIGTAFLLAGAVLLIAPERYLDEISLRADSRLALSDLRALYGGLEIAFGALILAFARRRETLGLASALSVAAFGGLLLGRFAGFVLDGPPDSGLFWGITAFECCGFVFALVALFRTQRDA